VNMPRPIELKRSPVRIDDAEAAELGSILELELDGLELRWKSGSSKLLWFPELKCLGWFQGTHEGRRHTIDSGSIATRNYEGFHQRRANHERTTEFPTLRRPSWQTWHQKARRIDYASKKWGRSDQYTHDLGPGVRLYRYGGLTKSPWLWILRGGRLTVTERGIIG
jgi:hypothetical protein